MEGFKGLVVILLSAVLINNYVLSRFLGICPFLGVSKKVDQALGMGVSVTVVMILSALVTWPIQHLVLDRFGLGYLQTIVFILVIASLVQMLEIILKRFSPALHQGLGVYLPLITTNCAVTDGYGFFESIVSSLGCGLGFLLALLLFSGLRSRIDESEVPKPFRGIAITLIAASFISLAFMGFAGLVEDSLRYGIEIPAYFFTNNS